MKGDKKAIEYLNKILGNELIAINQYFLHAKMLKDWGYDKLSAKVRAESIDEMNHADLLADRILFLEGLPNFQKLGKINIGQTIPEMFECDKGLEEVAIPDLREAITFMEEIKDFGSRDLLSEILRSEEEHLDWLETQIGLVESMGLPNFLQSQV